MIKLLPEPRYLKETKNDLLIVNGMYIVLNSYCDESDFFAAEQLRDTIKEISGINLIIEKDEAIDRGGEKTLRVLTIAGILALRSIFNKVKPLPAKFGNEGYTVEVDDRVVLTAKGSAGLFYGVQTLKQLIYKKGKEVFIKGIKILDWPAFKYRGIMLDISRGQVPKINSLKEMIVKYSSLKINLLNLYTEHTFKFKKHPLIGKNAGGYSARDINEIDEFAKKHFVELAGSFQSFGHQAHILNIPKYYNLRETKEGWDLTPARKETYKLLKDLYSEIAPSYSSKLFNINCDETFTLGRGQSKGLVKKFGKGMIYISHIKKVKKLLDKYGKKVMMWADIVLNYPKLLKHIPKDIIMLVWGYTKPIDISYMRKVKKAGFDFIVCPGTCSSFKLIPEINISKFAQRGTIKNAYKSKALGILCTEWGTEMSHDNLFGYNTYGFSHCADLAWSIDNDNKKWKTFPYRFAEVIFGDPSGKTSLALEKFADINKIFKEEVKNNFKNVSNFEWYNINRDLYYESSFPPHLISQLNLRLIKKFLKKVGEISKLMYSAEKHVTKNKEIWEEYKFSLEMHKYLAHKLIFFSKLEKFFKNKKDNIKLLLKEIKKLKKEVIQLKDKHRNLWLKTSKKEGFVYTSKRYEWQVKTYERLNSMLSKKNGIKKLLEVRKTV